MGLRLECLAALAVAMALAAGSSGSMAQRQAAACSRDDFANVVEQASSALRDMNAQNTPNFQAKLRSLKERRGWSQDQFIQEAAPLVQDDEIRSFDDRMASLLNSIQGLGEGGGGREPDCALLDVLRTHMRALVETTQAKWAYMQGRVDQALAVKP